MKRFKLEDGSERLMAYRGAVIEQQWTSEAMGVCIKKQPGGGLTVDKVTIYRS